VETLAPGCQNTVPPTTPANNSEKWWYEDEESATRCQETVTPITPAVAPVAELANNSDELPDQPAADEESATKCQGMMTPTTLADAKQEVEAVQYDLPIGTGPAGETDPAVTAGQPTTGAATTNQQNQQETAPLSATERSGILPSPGAPVATAPLTNTVETPQPATAPTEEVDGAAGTTEPPTTPPKLAPECQCSVKAATERTEPLNTEPKLAPACQSVKAATEAVKPLELPEVIQLAGLTDRVNMLQVKFERTVAEKARAAYEQGQALLAMKELLKGRWMAWRNNPDNGMTIGGRTITERMRYAEYVSNTSLDGDLSNWFNKGYTRGCEEMGLRKKVKKQAPVPADQEMSSYQARELSRDISDALRSVPESPPAMDDHPRFFIQMPIDKHYLHQITLWEKRFSDGFVVEFIGKTKPEQRQVKTVKWL
jgi:hypothetical protein